MQIRIVWIDPVADRSHALNRVVICTVTGSVPSPMLAVTRLNPWA